MKAHVGVDSETKADFSLVLRAPGGKLNCFCEADFRKSNGIATDSRVRGQNSVHISPNPYFVGI
jgi:hypothetical protein